MSSRQIIVVGGGAAGFFGAITCAEASPDARVAILEKSARFLDKVRISGGGRCNVTNACSDPREFVTRYPRGDSAMIGALHRFQARDTVAWFESRGVRFIAEPDGRLFPSTNSSQTIIDCLVHVAQKADVEVKMGSEEHMKLAERLAAEGREGAISLRGEALFELDGKSFLVK